jgi:general secretion pathway protein B
MSYILEALKKAQTERQLGSAPTIHALPIHAAELPEAGASRTPMWIAIGVAVLMAAGAGAMWWRQGSTAPAPVVVAAAQPAVVTAPPMQAVLQAPAIVPPPAVQVPAPAPVTVQAPAPVAVQAPAPVAMQLPAPRPAAPLAPKPAAALPRPAPEPVVAALPPPAPAQKAAPTEPPAPAPEDALPFMRDLPDQVRSGLPQVTFGGYMYSKNPADRLLLIDKALRHEGEEVAPGLFLEKLLPKAAVMNYRGTRYRVSYN